MNIKMIGIDHQKASLEIREMFAFTKKEAQEAMEQLLKRKDVSGCVILSTCNRMELWLSCEETFNLTALELLCGMKHLEKEVYKKYFVCRENEHAVNHLFLLAGGLKSRIIGEDQILSQIKEAISFARKLYCSDQVLEVLFRMAVTAGKSIKANIPIPRANISAAHKAIEALKDQGNTLLGKRCLVIGNGEMGQLTALAMRSEGADVTVTIRQYKSGVVNIPYGCGRINYGERYQMINDCDYIFSATSSPNVTITKKDLLPVLSGRDQIYVDLAVPRDMDPDIAEIDGVTLYDIDSFQIEWMSKEMQLKYEEAKKLAEEKTEEFITWYQCKDLIPKLQQVSKSAANDVVWRTKKVLNELDIEGEEQRELERSIDMAASKVISKLMFQIRDGVNAETFRECVEAISKVYSAK